MADLVTTFAQTARRRGDATALITRQETVGFAELERRADAFAARCAAKGIGKGDRVILAMPVGIDLFTALAGAWRVGAVVVFPEPAMGLRGFLHAVRVTRPKALIATGAYRLLRLLPAFWGRACLGPRPGGAGSFAPVTLEAGDPALISFTSGSTGAPKGIVRSHGFLMAQNATVSPLLTSDADEVDLVAFPVFTLVNLAAGRASVLPDWRLNRPEDVTPGGLAAWIRKTGVTRALLPPVLCETLSAAENRGALHTVFTGGGPVLPQLVDRLQGLRVVSVYGSTEAEPIAELDWADADAEARAEMLAGGGLLAGQPVPEVQLRIVDDEVQVAGAHVNDGYLDPAMDAGIKLREGGTVWHRTGDAGRLDDRGRLWLLGRYGAIATRDGARIYPFAVEVAAMGLPGVRRAALWQGDGAIRLAIEGAGADMAACDALADRFGIDGVTMVDAIPMDRRHRSKVDYTALDGLMRG
ncbi:MAG: AMP-binding protein [Alphaproteobacteria bacterium]|nr:AMP-binding protein [Alphaproteobacteria bacterium]